MRVYSYELRTKLVHGEGTSLSRVSPYRFCSDGTLDKPSWGYRFGYRFRVGPYRFCSGGNPTTLSILLWSYLILSDTHIYFNCDSEIDYEKLHLLGTKTTSPGNPLSMTGILATSSTWGVTMMWHGSKSSLGPNISTTYRGVELREEIGFYSPLRI